MWFVKFFPGGNFRRLELWLCSGSGWHLTNHQTVSTPSQFQRVNSGVDAVGLLSLFILIVSILRLFHLKMKTWLAYFRTFPIHLGSPWAFPEDPNKHLHQLLQMLYYRNGSWTLLKSLEISNKHLFSHMIISSVSTSHNFVVLKFIQWKNASSGRRATQYNWRLRYKEFCSWGQVCSFKMESLLANNAHGSGLEGRPSRTKKTDGELNGFGPGMVNEVKNKNTLQYKVPPKTWEKLTSETTFGHSKVVFRPLLRTWSSCTVISS